MMTEYRKALKRENDRLRSWRKTKKGMLTTSFMSLDAHMAKFDDPSKVTAFSDGGRGAVLLIRGAFHDDVTYILNRLNNRDRAFAIAVLNGANHEDLGISRQLFSYRLARAEKNIQKLDLTPPSKSSL